jgi:hypothetical protein
MHKRIKERKRGKGKIDYLKKLCGDASPNDQGVSIKVNM